MALSLQRILVPVDFEPLSLAAIDYAATVAATVHASITLLHVYALPHGLSNIVPGASASDVDSDVPQLQARLDDRARALEARFGVQARTLLEPGDVVENIINRARIGGFGLIVMGTRGSVGIKRLVLGSVTEEVLRQAPCPVLTLNLTTMGSP